MATRTIKVIYISGTGKSGSTLLGKLLGQVDGLLDVGELINLDVQIARGRRCGCGSAVGDCVLWRPVVGRVTGNNATLDHRLWRRLKTRYLPVLLIPGAGWWLRRYYTEVYDVYRAVDETWGPVAIVDGSKSAFHGAILALHPDFEVYTVHLVRDVRASEGSMDRLRRDGIGKFAARRTWWNCLRWIVANRLSEWAAARVGSPCLRVRYEDLVSAPERTLSSILRFVGTDADLGFIRGHTATVGRTHSVGGSDVRFAAGPMHLRLDERWRESLPRRTLSTIDAMTRRFRGRYGY